MSLSDEPQLGSVVRADVDENAIAHDRAMTDDVEHCPVCDGSPRVLVAVEHFAMRRLILELLRREHGCWTTFELDGELSAAIRRRHPDLVVIDDDGFRPCCVDGPTFISCDRMIVVGQEPDSAYRHHALHRGAGGWVARDFVGEEPSAAMREALGCVHRHCPPSSGDGSNGSRRRRAGHPSGDVAHAMQHGPYSTPMSAGPTS
jgi:hypothetical protein